MDIIHLLPDSVANQIAAGEVIQRPASCIKELVENSLDAGATSIHVLLWDAGRTAIQVIDDGKGMTETDARMAFERHATSKISSAQDLFSLRTMGFRGEALASICAVAQVELFTRRPEDEMGTHIEVNGSDVVCQEPCSCAAGTNFKVKNLFFNVPARRRFLKTDATELRNILTEFYRMVLVNPEVQFTLVSNDEILMELPAGTSKQRIEQVFGKSVNKQFTSGLVDIKSDTDLVSIRGFIGKPEHAGRNSQQFFFVNNRYMRHPYFHKAVMTAYQGMLQPEQQPSYFIYFDVNPEMIDVNIHPTKTEIKFADEQAIWQILQATVREALGKFHVAPSLDFDVPEDAPEIPVTSSETQEIQRPEISFDPSYNPFSQRGNYSPWDDAPTPQTTSYAEHGDKSTSSYAEREVRFSPSVKGWQKLYADLPDQQQELALDELQLFDEDLSALQPYQFAGKYILLPAHGGLMVIDQHRAHLVVMFEQLRGMLQDHKGLTQQLLFPEIVELTQDEMLLLSEAKEDLEWVGFQLDQFSPTSYSLSGVPAVLTGENGLQVLHSILQTIRDSGLSARNEWRDKIALAIAEDAALRHGRTLSDEEMRDLVQRLFALDNYSKTPTGSRVLNVLPMHEIDKLL